MSSHNDYLPQKQFFAWLRDRGFIFDADGGTQPCADLGKAGTLKLRWYKVGPGRYEWQTVVTRQGLEWLRQRWHVGPGRSLALQAATTSRQALLPGLLSPREE